MDEITRLAAELGDGLCARGEQVATAESCTGGGVAEAITRIPGSSTWFEAGYVTYSDRQKTIQLGVSSDMLELVGAVSQEVVIAMVQGAQVRSGARYAVAVSGIAGPNGGSPEKPVGTVWLGWSDGNRLFTARRLFHGNRDVVRRQTVESALAGLIRLVAGGAPEGSVLHHGNESVQG